MLTPTKIETDTRLIEAGFPCHQVGAETQRERDTGKAPPTHRLHVWWARRPLTPSRAAILGSLLPADADVDLFLRQLGIEKRIVEINGVQWTLDPKDGVLLRRILGDPESGERLPVDSIVLARIEKEAKRRSENLIRMADLVRENPSLEQDVVFCRWRDENAELPEPYPELEDELVVRRIAADPNFGKLRINLEQSLGFNSREDVYGYGRAFAASVNATEPSGITVLDPTSGGGSIPFEAMRLGHNVIANELNPVATVILHATLRFPRQFGPELAEEIGVWGNVLLRKLDDELSDFFPDNQLLNSDETDQLQMHLGEHRRLCENYCTEEIKDYLYCRQVTCPHCGGKAPLMNSCWLSKEGQQWGVEVVPDPKTKDVIFRTYRAIKGKGPNGEDPEAATVDRGTGICIHCRQAIHGDEIKAQARGESSHGKWFDRLYCVVAVRYQPKLDRNGEIQRYRSGDREGEIKTEKVTFFRPPNPTDLDAIDRAEKGLAGKWDAWDREGLIPTEEIPPNSNYNRGHRMYGALRWCDMYTPRQLLGHLTLVRGLKELTQQLIDEIGHEKAKAVCTYLQCAIDKGLDYNSTQTLWITQRRQVAHTFTRHNFAIQWTFGELMYVGPSSGFSWALRHVAEAYRDIANLCPETSAGIPEVVIRPGTAAYIPEVETSSVDCVVMDPPYYDNVQYAEISDYFYVWMKRGLQEFYPQLFTRRLVDKADEAVANPARDGSGAKAKARYHELMSEILKECRRVVKPDGVMTLMFTHKKQEAWETLVLAIIENGWIITSSYPVDSEFSHSQHQLNTLSAASSIFITCRKRNEDDSSTAMWSGFGGSGVQQRIADAVAEALPEFEALQLNPVDEMVASYGRALRVLSQQWPVMDGDDLVSPIRAMNEASRVVAERQIARLTDGRLQVTDLQPEAAMALTLFGIYGLNELPYDEALNLSRSLNIKLEAKSSGYNVDGRMIGINQERTSRRQTSREAEDVGFHAPLLRSGSKLRLAKPDERSEKRLESPQTEWDMLCGLIMAHREGDTPVARAYLQKHADDSQSKILDLLHVWAEELPDEDLRKEGQAILFGLR